MVDYIKYGKKFIAPFNSKRKLEEAIKIAKRRNFYNFKVCERNSCYLLFASKRKK